jgi:hypothetical protein
MRSEWGGGVHVAGMGNRRDMRSFGGETQGKGNQEDLGVGGKPINTDPEGTG